MFVPECGCSGEATVAWVVRVGGATCVVPESGRVVFRVTGQVVVDRIIIAIVVDHKDRTPQQADTK